jgi:hypothetical protein
LQSGLTIRAENLGNSKYVLAVPRVVPPTSKFNHLKCQTIITALTGAKGILLNCKTGRS